MRVEEFPVQLRRGLGVFNTAEPLEKVVNKYCTDSLWTQFNRVSIDWLCPFPQRWITPGSWDSGNSMHQSARPEIFFARLFFDALPFLQTPFPPLLSQ